MSTLKRILVATDFSKSAGFALTRASQLAIKNKTNFTVLHVLPENWIDKIVQWFSSPKNSQFLQFKQDAQAVFNKKIKPVLKNFKTKFVVKMGRENETITQYAKGNKVDLLAIGAHGHYYFHEYFLGTSAEAIVKNAPCPVLVVKRKPSFRYNKILVPIDFSSASRKAVEFACKHFPKACIEILHVEDLWYDQSTYRPVMEKRREGILRRQMFKIIENKIDAFLKKSKVNRSATTVTIRGGYPAKVIAREVKKKNIDLVIIGTRGQTKLQYLMIGSVAERVLQEVGADIIAVPPQ